ncbi:hypothetical protein OZ668_16670 [Elizabethkingia sp. HX XZB]|uniref:hypothetical protein n=1 Tax=Elizabethkingia sp. HX XZB TaxID=3003193 RepID=UPI002A24CA5D|nr:hypothetical protein [Elizabethkingia sp. HX XZB]MDX8569634.1 hypothetical protein [Elizabethkingia sp. HX XZB]
MKRFFSLLILEFKKGVKNIFQKLEKLLNEIFGFGDEVVDSASTPAERRVKERQKVQQKRIEEKRNESERKKLERENKKKRIEIFSKIRGVPINKKLLKELQEEFRRLGGEMVYSEESFQYIASREKVYNEQIEALTFNESTIFLNKDVTTSAVYEELIHAKQFREGRYNNWVKEYNNIIAENLMEKEAAEELLEKAAQWKLPKNETELIKERLEFFKNELKILGYGK